MTAVDLYRTIQQELSDSLGSPGVLIVPPRPDARQQISGLMVVIPMSPQRTNKQAKIGHQSTADEVFCLELVQYNDTAEGALQLHEAADAILEIYPNATSKPLPIREDAYPQINIDIRIETLYNTRTVNL